MLRITIDRTKRVVTYRLEGRLEGPWVGVLAECWRDEPKGSRQTRYRVDLNGMTFVDGPGKARLARMHRDGAEFIADDLLTKSIVAEISANHRSYAHESPTGNENEKDEQL